MNQQYLPEALENILTINGEHSAIFTALLPVLGEVLKCDRCFLYLRHPHTRIGRTPYCWVRSPKYPDVSTKDWVKEPESLPKEDPLFAAALKTEASIFIEDVETASPEIVNRNFEKENFGHRALVHAHLCQAGMLWGVLQPCIFEKPRIWSECDRFVIAQVTKKITPLAVTYVNAAIG